MPIFPMQLGRGNRLLLVAEVKDPTDICPGMKVKPFNEGEVEKGRS